MLPRRELRSGRRRRQPRQLPSLHWAGERHRRAIKGAGRRGGGFAQIHDGWEGFLAVTGFPTALKDQESVAGRGWDAGVADGA